MEKMKNGKEEEYTVTYPSCSYPLFKLAFCFNRSPACHHFYKQHSKRIHVTFLRELIGLQVFWIQVPSSSFNLGRDVSGTRISVRCKPCEPKVRHLCSEIPGEEDVGRLNIPVNDRMVCRRVQPKMTHSVNSHFSRMERKQHKGGEQGTCIQMKISHCMGNISCNIEPYS